MVQSAIAGVPLVVGLLGSNLGLGETGRSGTLTVLLFVCTAVVVGLALREGPRFGNLSYLMFVLGFMFWYALPGLFRQLGESVQTEQRLPWRVPEETVVASIIYLSCFLFVGVLTW